MQRHARHVGLISGIRRGHSFARALRDAGYVGAAALAPLAKTSRLAVGLDEADDVPRHAAWPCPWRGCSDASALDGGTLECRASSRSQLRSSSAIRATSASIARPVRDQGVFLGQSGGGVTKGDSYRDVAATKKYSPKTGPSSHLKRA